MTPTDQYVQALTQLKPGELALLRSHAGQRLDESVHGFDLFAGLWWPLRARSQYAPRRGVAWVVAKLYAARPIKHSPGETLAWQLARCRKEGDPDDDPVTRRFDRMLSLPLAKIEPALHWGLNLIAGNGLKVDWAELTDDLSLWERESKRLKWAGEFLKSSKEERHVD